MNRDSSMDSLGIYPGKSNADLASVDVPRGSQDGSMDQSQAGGNYPINHKY